MKSLSNADAPAGLAAINAKRPEDWCEDRPRSAWREPFASTAEAERRVSNRAMVAGKAFTGDYPEYGQRVSVKVLLVEPAKLDYVGRARPASARRKQVAFRSSRLVLTRSGECGECRRYARVRWYKIKGPPLSDLKAWHNLENERVQVPPSLLTPKDDPRSALCTSCAHAVWEDNSSTRLNRTEKREEQALDLWARGVPDERIALEVGRSVNTVRRYEEIELGKLVVRESRAMVALHLRSTGIGVPEISRRLGVTQPHVRNLLKVDPMTARRANVVLGVFRAFLGSHDDEEMLRRLAAIEQELLEYLEAVVRTGSWIQPTFPLLFAVGPNGHARSVNGRLPRKVSGEPWSGFHENKSQILDAALDSGGRTENLGGVSPNKWEGRGSDSAANGRSDPLTAEGPCPAPTEPRSLLPPLSRIESQPRSEGASMLGTVAPLPTDERLSEDAERLQTITEDLIGIAFRLQVRFPGSAAVTDAIERFLASVGQDARPGRMGRVDADLAA